MLGLDGGGESCARDGSGTVVCIAAIPLQESGQGARSKGKH
jgi:hypothetical protein